MQVINTTMRQRLFKQHNQAKASNHGKYMRFNFNCKCTHWNGIFLSNYAHVLCLCHFQTTCTEQTKTPQSDTWTQQDTTVLYKHQAQTLSIEISINFTKSNFKQDFSMQNFNYELHTCKSATHMQNVFHQQWEKKIFKINQHLCSHE